MKWGAGWLTPSWSEKDTYLILEVPLVLFEFWTLFCITCTPHLPRIVSKLCSRRVCKVWDYWNNGILITCQETLALPIPSREVVRWAAGSLNKELWSYTHNYAKCSYWTFSSWHSELEDTCWRSLNGLC